MNVTIKVLMCTIIFAACNTQAYEVQSNLKETAYNGLINDDLNTAKISIKKMGQNRSYDWPAYNGALKVLEKYLKFKKSVSKFDKDKSDNNYHYSVMLYKKYIKSVKTDFISKKFDNKYINHLKKQIDYALSERKRITKLFNKKKKNENEIIKALEQKRIEKAERKQIKIEKQQTEIAMQRAAEENALRQARRDRNRKRTIEKDIAENRKIEKQKKINIKINDIDLLAKSKGFYGYTNENIIQVIYKTQNEGGLEKYMNKIVGCHDYNQDICKRGYHSLKAIQILENGVLYSYTESAGNMYLSFVIFSDKEPGKMYQEGQSIENTFHYFDGMYQYNSLLGAKRSVPIFRKAKLYK